jgi:hypothetical protein
MNSPLHHCSRERRRRFRRPADVLGIQTGVLAALILAIFHHAHGAPEPARQVESLQTTGIYDPDPNHLWNRLFVTFYRQQVSSLVNNKTFTHRVGPDVLDPPIGYHPRFLLDDEPFHKCDSVLDEFLSRQGAKMIQDPVKRVVLQRDLWAVFDALAQVPSSSLKTTATNTPAQEQDRIILERKLARAIRSLALSRAEIGNLPDTYAAAITSGGFSDRPEGNRYNFLPADLFATNSAWYEVDPSDPRLHHSLMVGGRSVFRAFVKSPVGFTNVLGDHIREIEEWSMKYQAWAQLQRTNRDSAGHKEPQRPEGLLPVGTQFLLLREMICLDENLQMVPTHIIESVQFRTTSKSVFSGQAIDREAELSRVLLFAGKQGGLRPVADGELRIPIYAGLGHLEVDAAWNSFGQVAFPKNCLACHQQTSRLMSGVRESAKPVRSTSIESISQWKVKKGRMEELRELAPPPVSNGK